jgi:hypothetical protein
LHRSLRLRTYEPGKKLSDQLLKLPAMPTPN